MSNIEAEWVTFKHQYHKMVKHTQKICLEEKSSIVFGTQQ